MKRRLLLLFLAIVALAAAFFYWQQTQEDSGTVQATAAPTRGGETEVEASDQPIEDAPGEPIDVGAGFSFSNHGGVTIPYCELGRRARVYKTASLGHDLSITVVKEYKI